MSKSKNIKNINTDSNNQSIWAEFKNLDVFINQSKILSKVNINLKYGENIVILGPNGSGKSTFLKLINRSIYPIVSRGSYIKLFNNKNINIWDLRKKVGFLFTEMNNRVNKYVTANDLIISGFTGTFNARYSDSLKKEQLNTIKELIINFELDELINKQFIHLSEGQKRRILLARALVYRPDFLVLDEPFANLDMKSSYLLIKSITNLIDKSINIIYVTHNLESILSQTNRVIFMKEGKIIKEGKPDDLLTSSNLSELYNISIEVIKHDRYWRSIPKMN